MKWIKESNEVLYSANKRKLFSLSKNDVHHLQNLGQTNERKKSRICTHNSIKENIHEMFIYHSKGAYIRPHKHLNKEESFHLISGEIVLLIFDKYGKITENLSMGDYASGKPFYYRISSDIFHTQIICKDTVFHEVTKGPFNKKDTIFPDWSPNEQDKLFVENYQIEIQKNFNK